MPDEPAAPVFVDPTGRRRRTIRTTAVVGASSLLGVTGLIVAALLGAPLGSLNPLPEPASGPPAAVEPMPAQQPDGAPAEGPAGTTSSSAKPGTGRSGAPGATPTTVPGAAPVTTTTATRGNKPTTPPGKPTDLPTQPTHTR